MRLLKILILGAIFVSSSFTVTAQKKYGIRAGVNISGVSGNDIPDTDNLTGYYVGVYKEMKLIPKLLYLNPELQYSSQGFSTSSEDVKIDYITVPVLAKLYFLKLFSFETGPQFGFKINDNYDGPEDVDFESFDPAWAFGMSLNLPFGLSIDGRYVTSFNEVITDLDAKNQVIQVGAGFKF